MTLMVDFLTIDAHNPRALARFWEQALPDYEILDDPDSEPSDDDEEVGLLPVTRRGPKMLFLKVPDEKKVKNRLHLDLRPSDGSKDDEVARLEALGATKVDIGQGDEVTWTVMADPEGNEFCVLRALTDEEKQKWAAWAW